MVLSRSPDAAIGPLPVVNVPAVSVPVVTVRVAFCAPPMRKLPVVEIAVHVVGPGIGVRPVGVRRVAFGPLPLDAGWFCPVTFCPLQVGALDRLSSYLDGGA